jgi:cytochrome b6-f complex iron-sulfur subunit
MSVVQSTQSESLTSRVATAQVEVDAPSRREFLNYVWMASLVMLIGQTTGGLIWFMLPRFREGMFGGTFTLAPDRIPPPGGAPNLEAAGRFWLAHPQTGLLALYVVCTHLGCLYKWMATNDRFECPCHGSKFERDGKYIEGPAPRSLDRFRTTVVFADGTTVTTNDAGDPIPLDGREITKIMVDTGNRILRAGRI